jgi:transcriptional regulator with XRE-family HTH domain
MVEMKLRSPGTAGAWLLALSPAGYKVLSLLRKGCAYQVQGAWRFRGSHSPIREPTLAYLLARGLAERVETDQHAQIRITEAGRSINREGALQSNSALRKPSLREADRVALTNYARDIFFGDRVQSRRIALDLTQGNVAHALGTTVHQMQQWEAGTSRIGADRLLELTQVLDVSPAFFFPDDVPAGSSGAGQKETPRSLSVSAAQFAEVSRLTHAFGGIGDPAFRAAVIELAERLAGIGIDTPYT